MATLKQERIVGLAFALPWLIGLSAFVLYPFVASFYYSLCDYSVLEGAVWCGAENYKALLDDDVFLMSIKATMLYALLSIPAGITVSIAVAMLLDSRAWGASFCRAIYYLPHLIPIVAAAMVWMFIFLPEGYLNAVIRPALEVANRLAGRPGWLSPPNWLSDTRWALPALAMMSLWSVGQAALIYLAGLQDIPPELYEAAELDGANWWQKIRHITIPQLSPVILFNSILSIIGTFQVFVEPYIMTGGGGPARTTYFLAMYIYDNAFAFMKMGYACTVAWVLFAIIMVLTVLAFRFAKDRVFYAGR